MRQGFFVQVALQTIGVGLVIHMDWHPLVHIGVAVDAVTSILSSGVLVESVAILAILDAQACLVLLDGYYSIIVAIDVTTITGA